MRNIFISIFLGAILAGCFSAKKINQSSTEKSIKISSLKFLDEYNIPFNFHFKNTWVGGLSGIDFDAENNLYYIISDERSTTSAARFYTANIEINNYKIDTVKFISVSDLRNAKNDTFPALNTMPESAADPESIRFNKETKTLFWSSEGDKAMRNGKMIYQNPWIYEMDLNGNFKDSFFIPSNINMNDGDNGARENDALEGLSFSRDDKHLWSSMEGPTYEDGPLASAAYANAPVRITKFDIKSRKTVAQYGYLLDAVAVPPVPESAFSINGISEILEIDKNKLLVLERSFSTGIANCAIKIYLADFSNATDVSSINSLYNNKNYISASKKMLFSFDDLKRYIDNVEGVTLGPLLPNGNRSLIIITDNNYNSKEKQQVFLFEVEP